MKDLFLFLNVNLDVSQVKALHSPEGKTTLAAVLLYTD